MSISRRSFLKLAGLTTVAVAGTALFTSCTVASYLQIEFTEDVYTELAKDSTDPEGEKAKAKELMTNVNLALKAFPFVGVTSIQKSKVEETVNACIRQVVTDNEKAEKIIAMIQIEGDDEIKANGDLYGAITIKVGLKPGTTAKQAAVLAEAVA